MLVRGTHVAGVGVGALGAGEGGPAAAAVLEAACQAPAWAFTKASGSERGFYACAGALRPRGRARSHAPGSPAERQSPTEGRL